MAPAEILASLFPAGHDVVVDGGRVRGRARLGGERPIEVLGIAAGLPLGIEDALWLAGEVLGIVKAGDRVPILLTLDSGSQRMSRRDELLGLNEYLAHLAKALVLAESEGHRTIGLLYGHTAAGAFIATALAVGTLIALPEANPEVMDLPSMARVTKLPLEVLAAKAKANPVFAPGIDNLATTGAVGLLWTGGRPLADAVAEVLAAPPSGDVRDRRGKERKGRPLAADIAARVIEAARRDG